MLSARKRPAGRLTLRDAIVSLLCEPALHGLDLSRAARELLSTIETRGPATAEACGAALERLREALAEGKRDAA